LAAGCWLLAAGYWLLAAGCWLLAAGCWLLARCWLLAAGCWLLGELALKGVFSVGFPASLSGGFPHGDSGPLNGR
jgi:hypothetical protein